MEFIFAITILILSVILHEISHGYVAYLLGDSTAKYAGRLTLNPLSHLDIFGSVILPVFTYLTGGFIIGWAKPVPFNPYNLKNQKWGPAIVGAAGPLTNLLIVVIFGTLIRLSSTFSLLPVAFFQLASLIVFINLILAVLNLIPFLPLTAPACFPLFCLFAGKKFNILLNATLSSSS